MTFTYEPDAQPFTAMGLADLKSRNAYRARVRRSDGVFVWLGDSYFREGTAKQQAGRTAAKFRAYLAQHGECWYDRDKALKLFLKRRGEVRRDTARELQDCASQGARAAFEGAAEDTIPYGADTAQGIVWDQAYRLTLDRLSDWDAENPKPVAP